MPNIIIIIILDHHRSAIITPEQNIIRPILVIIVSSITPNQYATIESNSHRLSIYQLFPRHIFHTIGAGIAIIMALSNPSNTVSLAKDEN